MSAKRRKNPLISLINFIGTLILIAAIVVGLALAVPKVAGIQSYVVVSGSMEPSIPVGSLVYVRGCDPQTIAPGEVIMFYKTRQADVTVTHRVVENHPEDGELITKGDANAQNDLEPTLYQNVIGRVLLHIPKAGLIAAPLATMKGKIGLLLVILAGFLLTEVGSRRPNKKREEKE